MDAYDLVLKGLEYAKKGNIVKTNIEKAVELFEQAITSEPTYARAHAWRACSLGNLMDWEDDPDPKLFTKALESANLALDLDPNEPEVHRVLGAIKLWYERDHEMGKYHFEKARELCPSDVYIIQRYATALIYFGEFEQALNEVKRAMRLDPFSHDLLHGTEALCHYWLENYEESVSCFKKNKSSQSTIILYGDGL